MKSKTLPVKVYEKKQRDQKKRERQQKARAKQSNKWQGFGVVYG